MGAGSTKSESSSKSEFGFDKTTRNAAGAEGRDFIIPQSRSQLETILSVPFGGFTADTRGFTPEQATLFDKTLPSIFRKSLAQVSAGLGRRGFLRPENVLQVAAGATRGVANQFLPLLLQNALTTKQLVSNVPLNFEISKQNAITNAANIVAAFGRGGIGQSSSSSSGSGPSPFNNLIPTFSFSS